MNGCRWDRERETYMHDGEPCRRDEYGDPTRHCQARRTCANHVGPDELTCARCLGRTRQDIRAIVTRACELMPEAVEAGNVETEALNLAGPAADVREWSERRVAMGQHLLEWEALARITPRQYEHARAAMEDDDEQHPYTVLNRWHMMLAEDYGHQLPALMTTTTAAAYLERTLPRMAQDVEQDFPLFAREMRKCRSHIEAVLRDSTAPERGAPCPVCATPAPRLVKDYGHWCERDDCDRIHFGDDSGDRWVCPRDREHAWTEEDYRRWVADVYEANQPA